MLKHIRSNLTLNNGVLLVAVFLMVSWMWGTVDAIQKNFTLQQQVDSLAQENALYDLQNETLKFEQKYYKTNEYLELSARERLNKALPGEKALILPPTTVTSEPEPLPKTSIKPITERSNFEQWMYFLFGDKSKQP